MDPKVIAAALLWLRNHYDVGRPELKQEVLARIDRVLAVCPHGFADMARFREQFPMDD